MTTEVIITSPVPNHLNICVEVLNEKGEVVKTSVIQEGKHAKFYVYSNQSLSITETTRKG